MIVIFAFILLLTSSASAANWLDYVYTDPDGIRVVDVDSYNAAVAQELVDASGVDLVVADFWYFDDAGCPRFDNDAFEVAYVLVLEQLEQEQTEVVDFETTTDGLSDDLSSDTPLSDPVVPDSGSSGSMPDFDLNVVLPESDEDVVIFAEDNTESHIYAVSDQRSGVVYSLGLAEGLKDLMRSIFGEYTPVLTTIAVIETVDNVTTTTLVDAVAEGAAGVDWEYLSGVALFGILLFCLMKLLGGILK